MVLCRTSAPLVGLCMKLIQNGITAVVKGKDIARDLKVLIENANTKNIQQVLDYLESEKNKLIATIRSDRKCTEAEAKQAQKYLNLEDRCKCIENICLYSIKDVTELKTYIDRLFTDEKVTTATTNYFIIDDSYYSDRLATDENKNGWRRLEETDPEYIRINTITNYYEGNNPHNGNMNYDNGHEYFTYFKRLFKYPIDNDLFDESDD